MSSVDTKQLGLPPEVVAAWQARYDSIIGNAATDAEELEAIEQALARLGDGYVWTETGEEIAIGPQQWDKGQVEAMANQSTVTSGAEMRRAQIVVFGGIGIILLMCVGLLFVPSMLVPARANSRTPTPDAATARAQIQLVGSFVPVAVGGSSGRTTMDTPRSLEALEQAFPIAQGSVDKNGRMVMPKNAELDRVAVWLPSPVNWLIGLPESRILAMQPGDVVSVRTSAGRALRFVVERLQDVNPQAIEALGQNEPGVTLFPSQSTSLLVRLVQARYVFDAEVDSVVSDDGADVAGIGSSLNVQGGQIALVGVFAQAIREGRYRVTVIGNAALDHGAPAIFLTSMLGVEGQRYSPLEPAFIGPGYFRWQFETPALGNGEIYVAGHTINLGPLTTPPLTGEIVAVSLDGLTLKVQVIVAAQSADGAGASLFLPKDMTLTADNSRVPIAAQSITPSDVVIVPGQPMALWATFVLPVAPSRRPATYQINLLGDTWEVTLP